MVRIHGVQMPPNPWKSCCCPLPWILGFFNYYFIVVTCAASLSVCPNAARTKLYQHKRHTWKVCVTGYYFGSVTLNLKFLSRPMYGVYNMTNFMYVFQIFHFLTIGYVTLITNRFGQFAVKTMTVASTRMCRLSADLFVAICMYRRV